jgi:hypothetical protein
MNKYTVVARRSSNTERSTTRRDNWDGNSVDTKPSASIR